MTKKQLKKELESVREELVEALTYKDIALELARNVIQIDNLGQRSDTLKRDHKVLQKEHGVLLKKLDELGTAHIPF